jgi:hypothetical protein
MNVIRTTEGYMVELPNGCYLCDEHGDNLWDTRSEADAVVALHQGYNLVVDVRMMDVYGKRVVYPVCDKAKVFASIAGTKTLTEVTLRCIQKLGYAIRVVPQEPLTLDL